MSIIILIKINSTNYMTLIGLIKVYKMQTQLPVDRDFPQQKQQI